MSSFTRSRGRVMARCRCACAELPGARTYYTKVAHSELARDRRCGGSHCGCAAHAARRARLETKWSRARSAEARISDRELRRTHTAKVDWVHMEPDARQDFLRNLNEPPHLKLRVPGKAARKPAAVSGALQAPSQEAFFTRRCKRRKKGRATPSAIRGVRAAIPSASQLKPRRALHAPLPAPKERSRHAEHSLQR